MESSEITNLHLLMAFRRCAHLQYHYGQNPGQSRLLILLRQRGPQTQRAMCEITQRRAATLSQQLSQMEQDGLIVRSVNAEDKRNMDVALTPAGQLAAEEAQQERSRQADILFGDLPPADRGELLRLLELLRDRWADASAQKEASDR
jgi:DNA-binding MarR family transcriptional regulator